MDYNHAIELSLSPSRIIPFFADLERWFRLNPQWNVLAFDSQQPVTAGVRFKIEVEYERSEVKVEYEGVVEQFDSRTVSVRLDGQLPREIIISVVETRSGSFLKYREPRQAPPSAHEQKEIEFWLKSIGNYIQISNKRSLTSSLLKRFIDRFWLKMSPSGRRTVFFVVCAEGLSLLFFLLILGWLLIFKKI